MAVRFGPRVVSVAPSLAALVLMSTLVGCKDNRARVYTAPADPSLSVAAAPASTGRSTDQPPAEPGERAGRAPSPPWTVPPGWVDKPDPAGVRQASYAVTRGGKSLDIAVTAFPGGAGGELENVNRWRRELGLAEVAADALTGLSQPVPIGGERGQLYEFLNSGPRADGKPPERTYVAQLPAGGVTVYFKMRGEAALAEEEKANFMAWLASVQTGPEPSTKDTAAAPRSAPSAAPTAAANTPPDMRGAVAPPPSTDLPKWTAPAHWKSAGEKPMRLASFDVPGAGGTKGDLSISALGGGAGGLLANVNRWRGQVGLAPLDDASLAREREVLKLGDDTGTLVDLKGAEKRILAVVVARGDRTWFYKLTAPDALITAERENLVNFVRSVRY